MKSTPKREAMPAQARPSESTCARRSPRLTFADLLGSVLGFEVLEAVVFGADPDAMVERAGFLLSFVQSTRSAAVKGRPETARRRIAYVKQILNELGASDQQRAEIEAEIVLA